MLTHRLSKSRFLSGNQCHLRLWYDTNEPELAEPPDIGLQSIFDTGHEVGLLACKRYPDGHMIAHDHRHIREALEETQQILESGSASVLFEPAFEHEDVIVRPDILQKLPDGSWRLGEVKSTTKLKEVHVLDVAIQLWVLLNSGLDVSEAEVITLDRSYVFDGVRLDLDALFQSHPVIQHAQALQARVQKGVTKMLEMLKQSSAPDIAPGAHCFEPYECPYLHHCAHGLVWSDDGFRDAPNMEANARDSMSESENVDESDVQVEKLATAISNLKPPVRYLDFETFNPAIPRFAGTRTYDQIPFLFSVHTDGKDASVTHVDYLHDHANDPRPELTDRLINALGTSGSICVYSTFERVIINSLIRALPERANELKSINMRLYDMLPVVRTTYYHPDLQGSYSLKNVLPVLVPSLGYDDLSISDGRTATVQYLQTLEIANPEERKRSFDDLRAYCERDTLAMVELRRALEELSVPGPS